MNKLPLSLRVKDDVETPGTGFRIADVFRNGWLIVTIFLSVTALGTVHALTVPPVYEASSVIQLKRGTTLSGSLAPDTPAATEIEILRSRSILSQVAQRLQLDIRAEPKRRSMIETIRSLGRAEPAAGAFGRVGDSIHVSTFAVPRELFKRPFSLTVESGNRFRLSESGSGIEMDGAVGRVASSETRYGTIDVLVTALDAPPGAQFTVRRIPLLQATEQLQRSLVVTESGKQSNVVRATLQGADPELISDILNQIGEEYLKQRAAEESRDTARAKAVFDQQLDDARQALKNSDERYAQLLQRHGIADPAEEGKLIADQSAALLGKLSETRQRKSELSTRLGDSHPALEAVNRQIEDILRDLDRTAAKRRDLAAAERELSVAARDRQLISETNAGLLSQRAKFTTMLPSNPEVRVVDRSEAPVQALTLGFSTMVALSGFAGLILGIVASITKNSVVRKRQARTLPQREARFRLISMARSDTQ
jgi:tyrosine-protein kinase Etk/Wzc